MTKENQIYVCPICGNIISVLFAGEGQLVCCGKPMVLQIEKTAVLEGKEKHVPVVEINGTKVTIKVGSIPHPMQEEHYIMLIQLMRGEEVLMGKRLKPGDVPVAEFYLEDTTGIYARELCNLHGLWRN